MSMSMLLSIRALVVVNLQCSILSSLHPARVSNKARKIKVRYKLATNPYQIAMSLLSAPPSQSLPARSSRRILSCGRKSSFMAFFFTPQFCRWPRWSSSERCSQIYKIKRASHLGLWPAYLQGGFQLFLVISRTKKTSCSQPGLLLQEMLSAKCTVGVA